MLGLRLERRRREEKSVVVVDSGALNCPLGAKSTLTYARDVGIYVFIYVRIYIYVYICVCEKNTRIAKISSIHCTTQKVSSSHHHHDE